MTTPHRTTHRRALFVTATEKAWGAEKSLRTLLEAAPEGWSCSLLACSAEVAELCGPFAEKTLLVPVRRDKFRTLTSFGRAVAESSDDYDVIVLFSLKLLPLALALRARRANVPVVADIHDAPIGLDRNLSRFFLRFVDRTIAISRFVVDHLAIGEPEIVPRPILDDHQRNPSGRSATSTQVVLGVVGRIDPEKRIEVAIDAIHSLPSQYRLRVYGDPCIAGDDYLQMLQDRASKSTRIEFRGYRNTQEIYDEVDGVIVCNEREPSGRTVGEAMLRSKLVFAPDRGGALEYFDDSITGFVYQALNASSLARAIEAAFKPGRDSTLVGERARDKIIAERSPRAVALQYFNVLESVVEQH